MNLEMYDKKDIQAAISILQQCRGEGITDVDEAIRRTDSELNSLKRAVKVKVRKEYPRKKKKWLKCPECGGMMASIDIADGKGGFDTVFECRNKSCWYSTIVKPEEVEE